MKLTAKQSYPSEILLLQPNLISSGRYLSNLLDKKNSSKELSIKNT